MKTILTGLVLLIGIFAFASVGTQQVMVRDYGTTLTYNIVSVGPHATTLGITDATHEWIVQNSGTGNLTVWFDKTVSLTKGFVLRPAMVLGDQGGPKMYAYAATTTNIAVYQRLQDFWLGVGNN